MADNADRISTPQQASAQPKDELTFEAVGPQPRRKRRWLRYLALLIVLAGIGSAAWYAFKAGWYGQRGSEIPVIYANKDPVKVKPAKPGGMKVPDRDKLVYQRLTPGKVPPSSSQPVERLLPRAEAPMPVPSEPKVSTIPTTPKAPQAAKTMAEPKPVPKLSAPPPTSSPTQKVERLAPPQPPQKVEKVIPKNMLPKKPVIQEAKRAPPPAPPEDVKLPVKKIEQFKTPKTIESLLSKESAKAPAKTAVTKKAIVSKNAPFRVQLAAVRTREIARKEWSRIKKKNADILGKLSLSVMRADLGAKGIYYRLRAGPLVSEAKARALCVKLAARKVPCLVVRPNG